MTHVVSVLSASIFILCTLSKQSHAKSTGTSAFAYDSYAEDSIKAVPGENYLAELRQLISSAQHSITILHFNFFTENGETRKLAELLKRVKNQKPELTVDIILEGEKDLDKKNGAAKRNHLTKDFFKGSGVNLHFISGLRKDGTKPGVTHAKAVVVDEILLTGSTNLTNTSLTKNNEFNLAIRNKKASNFVRNYAESLKQNSMVIHPEEFGFEGTKILTDNQFLAEALNVIGEAKAGDSLNIATYFFRVDEKDDKDARRILSAIIEAKIRGAKIRVYLERNNNPDINQEITRSNLVVAKNLSDEGIDVYVDPEEKISHAKMIILDGKKKILLQGSTNLFRGDLNENHQINVRTDDATIVAKAQSWLTAKIAYESTPFNTSISGIPRPKMFRLWFGYAQNRSDLTSLETGVNEKLVPATTQYSKGRGLDAYLPALFKSNDHHPEIPDEVAIIAYSSAETYDAARMTPPFGPLYGPLHFSDGLFAKEIDGFKSGSAVAQPYDRNSFKLVKGLSAYHINAETVSWQLGATTLYVLKAQDGSSFEKVTTDAFGLVEENVARGSLDGALVAIDGNFETLLVWAHHGSNQPSVNFSSSMKLNKVIAYQIKKEGNVKFGLDEGASVSFETNLLSTVDLLKPILKYCADESKAN